MSEQLTLNQFRGNSCAVHLNEGPFCPAALFMYLVSHEFLPGSVGACYKDPCFSGSNTVNHFLYLQNGIRLPDNLVHFADLVFQNQGLCNKSRFIHCIADGNEKPVEVEWFLKEIVGSLFYRFNGGINIAMSRNHDYWR